MRALLLLVSVVGLTLTIYGQNICKGLYFKGSADRDRVVIPHQPQYDIGTGDFTVEAWVKTEPVAQRAPVIFSNRVAGASSEGFHFNVHNWLAGDGQFYDGNIYTYINGKGISGYPWGNAVSIQDGAYHHVAMAKYSDFVNDSTYIAFYNDGQLIRIYKMPGISDISVTNYEHLVIGFDYANQTITGFQGNIRNVKFWNKYLDPSYMAQHYDKEPDITDPSLVGYWKLNEGQGQVVNDYSSYQNHGTIGLNSVDVDFDPDWQTVPDNLCLRPNIVEADLGVVFACKGEDINLWASNDLTYKWWLESNPNAVLSTDSSVVVFMEQPDVLVVEGVDNYQEKVVLNYKPTDECLIIYDFISSNGDGRNDFFEIQGIDHYPSNQLWIYNKWGQEVYYAKDYKNDWGNGVEKGMYYYLLFSDLGTVEGHLMVK